MSREHPKKGQAKKLFIEHGYSGKEIHELLDISEKTISNWRVSESWEQERAIYSTTPEKLILDFYEQINLIKDAAKDEAGNKKPLSINEVNSIAALASSIQKIRGNISPQIVMQVLNSFNVYLAKTDLELAKKMTDYIADYYNSYKSEKV